MYETFIPLEPLMSLRKCVNAVEVTESGRYLLTKEESISVSGWRFLREPIHCIQGDTFVMAITNGLDPLCRSYKAGVFLLMFLIVGL